ncbi:hypothetical protein PY365_24495 [Roseiarcaceae bacterium H3SJ34-1]|uniref:hypothetical protein n=1 Tax=Terripilifer ovatus TaxID=3032367 RepID=UPI003AB92E8E|nr:hypothetical protein [Roseiarcaceae bacterium H3SJ34-1]
MKKIYGLAVGASLAVAAFAASPASALPLAAGLGASASDANTVSMIDQVQYRRGYGGRRGYYYGGRRGIGPGAAIAGVAALGILGAAAAASAQPNYYPAPAYGYGGPYYGGCYWERRPVFDAWGNPRGTHPFQVCR